MAISTMIGALIFGATIFPVAFPEETQMLKRAATLTREHMDNAARSSNGKYLGGYQTKEQARKMRTRIQAGETIYFPNGTNVIAEAGLNDTQIEDRWYAWDARE